MMQYLILIDREITNRVNLRKVFSLWLWIILIRNALIPLLQLARSSPRIHLCGCLLCCMGNGIWVIVIGCALYWVHLRILNILCRLTMISVHILYTTSWSLGLLSFEFVVGIVVCINIQTIWCYSVVRNLSMSILLLV